MLRGYNAKCYAMKADGTYSDHCDLEDPVMNAIYYRGLCPWYM